jgi:transketolase
VPGDAVEAGQALDAAFRRNGPTFIRLGRNPTPVLFGHEAPLQIGKIRMLRAGTDLTIAVCGVPTVMAIQAAEALDRAGVSVDLLEVSTIKPLDVDTLVASVRKTGKILTVEEHTIQGGLGGAVAEVLAKNWPTRMECVGIEDRFGESGDYAQLMKKLGICSEAIEQKAMRLIRTELH